MNKKLFFAAIAGVALASCSSEEYIGGSTNSEVNEVTNAISFQGGTSRMTRADYTGAEAAALLGNQFKVFGNLTKSGASQTVFDNYIVKYDETTKGNPAVDSTNVYGWTYLQGTQRVKYWDYAATRYDFVAFSGIPGDKDITSTLTNTLEGVSASNVGDIYASNKVSANVGGTLDVQYGEEVRFTFKRLASRVRLGFYETIPGYAVANVRFYYGDNALNGNIHTAKQVAGLRGSFPVSGDYNITYDANNTAVANIAEGATLNEEMKFGQLAYTTAKAADGKQLKLDGTSAETGDAAFLGTSSAQVTWAEISGEAWQTIMPSASNGENLVLRVDYDLIPEDGGAIINVYNASAVVPSQWAQWKPNYAYTYVFKINDSTNGWTNPPYDPEKDTDGDGIPDIDDDDDDNDGIPDVDDPDDDGDGIPDEDEVPDFPVVPDPDTENPNPYPTTGLKPIVFDAIVSNIEDYKQETITGVTALGGDAITTYNKESNITDAAEYTVGDVITLSSYSHGQWSVAYSDVEITEKECVNRTLTYTILNHPEDGLTIDMSDKCSGEGQECSHGAEFTAENVGYYVVRLHYLPNKYHGDAAKDVPENYVNVYKVIKIHD